MQTRIKHQSKLDQLTEAYHAFIYCTLFIITVLVSTYQDAVAEEVSLSLDFSGHPASSAKCYAYTDYLTENTIQLYQGNPLEAGVSFDIEEPTYILMRINGVENQFYASPGFQYNIKLDSNHIIFSIQSEDHTNELIQQLEEEIEGYFYQHTTKSGKPKKTFYSGIKVFSSETTDKLTSPKNTYFNEFMRLKLEELDAYAHFHMQDEKALKQFEIATFTQENYLLGNHAYWLLLEKYFKKRFDLNHELLYGEGDDPAFYLDLKRKIFEANTDENIRTLFTLFATEFCYDYLLAPVEMLKEDAKNIAASSDDEQTTLLANRLIASFNRINEGATVPSFTFKDKYGKTIGLNEFKGKPMLIEFWASWCPPCIREMKEMPALKKRLGDQIHFVSISVDEDYERMVAYLLKHPEYDWSFLHNGTDKKVLDAFAVAAYPTYLVVDKEGKLIYTLEHSPKHEIKKVAEKLNIQLADAH